MKSSVLKNWVVAGLVCLMPLLANGQARKNTGTIVGVVKEAGASSSLGVPYAVVSIPEAGVNVVTDDNGNYRIEGLAPAEYTMSVSSLGYEAKTLKVEVGRREIRVDFVLKVADFKLDQVVISATASKTGAATASKISRTAIEHMQANSLSDIMTLLPGADVAAYKPDLQGVNSQTIRGGVAMGTAVIMDGAPLSNNANLQSLAIATGETSSGAGSGAVGVTSGIDLRTITTDNVESVEVIRGVASVKYGDAASGAIIVNAKTGREPMTVRFQSNPNVYSVGMTQGVGLGNNKGFINYGADYAYSVADPREGYDSYQRVTARLSYTNTFFDKLNSTTSANFTWAKDKAYPNPDDDSDYQYQKSRDCGIRLTTKGTYTISKSWLKNLEYNLSFNYTDRLTYFADKATNGDVAYSFIKEDGAVLSSIPGGHFTLIDKDGKDLGSEITNIPAGYESYRSWVTPGSYDYFYNIYGKELNTYAKLQANFSGNIGQTNHYFIVGADFNSDGNVGRGKVFDYDNPPLRTPGAEFATQRERPYKDIPFLNRGGAYAEETFRANVFNRDLEIVAGARYDLVSGIDKGALAPRINASFEIIPDVLSIRGAYGVNVKTPPLLYIYPDNAYFDMLNFENRSYASYYDIPESQQFEIITTHVYDTKNYDLELAKVRKTELGVDLSLGKTRLSLTAYRDVCNNGYSITQGLDNWKLVEYNEYDVKDYPEDGSMPGSLYLYDSSNYLLSYSSPGNTAAYEQKGIEFVWDFGRIDALRTSFLFNGQYYRRESWSNGYLFYNKGDRGNKDIGVYDAKIANGVSKVNDFITNLVVTHNIPQLGFVISLTANVDWNYRSWKTYAENDDIPVKYISVADGKVYDFDPANADPNSKDYKTWLPILRNEANGAISPIRRVIEPAYNPALCINANVTKQFDKFNVSFFANNLFRSTPLQKSKKYPGTIYRRNGDVFFFGLQLTAKIF